MASESSSSSSSSMRPSAKDDIAGVSPEDANGRVRDEIRVSGAWGTGSYEVDHSRKDMGKKRHIQGLCTFLYATFHR
jgi:hypothetical protein